MEEQNIIKNTLDQIPQANINAKQIVGLVKKGGRVRDIHRNAVKYVNAHAQAQALDRIEGELTDEEASIVRRARNARQTPTKNADAGEYHRATALEALLGYLYLTGQNERLNRFLGLLTNMEG